MTDFFYADENMLRYSLAYLPPLILLVGGAVGLAGLKPYLTSRARAEAWITKNET